MALIIWPMIFLGMPYRHVSSGYEMNYFAIWLIYFISGVGSKPNNQNQVENLHNLISHGSNSTSDVIISSAFSARFQERLLQKYPDKSTALPNGRMQNPSSIHGRDVRRLSVQVK